MPGATTVNWWDILVRISATQRKALRDHPLWTDAVLTPTLDRLVAIVGNMAATLDDFRTALDGELRYAAADTNLNRGAWLEDQLIRVKDVVYTPEQVAELDELAGHVAATIAGAR